jgi:Glu-tRNA(Gln) amidotransferase subunit E-like FAD-binding protein
MDPPKKAEHPAERDKHLLRIYGKIPRRGNLLHHQLEVSEILQGTRSRLESS